ncbi:hypothetical protein TOPH_02360, partial [Tolypocladium ophioglossoides CBS 100239]
PSLAQSGEVRWELKSGEAKPNDQSNLPANGVAVAAGPEKAVEVAPRTGDQRGRQGCLVLLSADTSPTINTIKRLLASLHGSRRAAAVSPGCLVTLHRRWQRAGTGEQEMDKERRGSDVLFVVERGLLRHVPVCRSPSLTRERAVLMWWMAYGLSRQNKRPAKLNGASPALVAQRPAETLFPTSQTPRPNATAKRHGQLPRPTACEANCWRQTRETDPNVHLAHGHFVIRCAISYRLGTGHGEIAEALCQYDAQLRSHPSCPLYSLSCSDGCFSVIAAQPWAYVLSPYARSQQTNQVRIRNSIPRIQCP